MKITLAAIGKLKPGAEKTLIDSYITRLPWSITLKDAEEKRPLSGEVRKQKEAALLESMIAPQSWLVALDEKGKQHDSVEFAALLDSWQGIKPGGISFILGGAQGLEPALRKNANYLLSLGKMTLPHMIARVVLVEQLYRAHTILTRHPYHKM